MFRFLKRRIVFVMSVRNFERCILFIERILFLFLRTNVSFKIQCRFGLNPMQTVPMRCSSIYKTKDTLRRFVLLLERMVQNRDQGSEFGR